MFEEEFLKPQRAALPWRVVAPLVILALVAGGGFYAYRLRGAVATAPTYSTAPVTRGDVVVGVSATGPISTAASIPLNFKNNGLLTKVNVKPGDTVKAGEALAQEDPTDLRHAADQAQATLEVQQAALAKLQAGPNATVLAADQTAIENAAGAVSDAQANLATVQQRNAADLATAQTSVATAQQAVADAQRNLAATQGHLAATVQADATTVANARQALASAQQGVAAVHAQVAANTAGDRTALSNAQAAAGAAATALIQAQQAIPADQAVQAQQVAAAKAALNTAQVGRDGACGQDGGSTACKQANAAVIAAQTGVDQAAALARQAQGKGQQAVTTAQGQLDQASAVVKTAADALNSHLAAYQANVVTAQGQVTQANGALQTAQRAQQTDAAAAQQTLAQATQAVHQAEAGLTDAQNAVATAAATAADNIQAAQAQIDQARAQLRIAQAAKQKDAAPPSAADLAAARAQVANAAAALATAQDNLASATLTAPIAATVAQVNDIAGQYMAGGSAGASNSTSSNTSATAFIVLTDLNSLQVVAQVNEADMAKVALGEPVQFTLNAFPGQTFTGKVGEIQPLGTTANNVVTYNVTCAIDRTATTLLPGMTANVTIVTGQQQHVTVVPDAALAFAQSPAAASVGFWPSATPSPPAAAANAGHPATVLLLRNGKAVRRAIQVGLDDGSRTAVLAGLASGDAVITGGGTG